ncbi:MAG: phosphotransferase [Chloroflexi bacterium]|nr:phosphotransferase [Chloroflexota bacterium]
MAERTAKPALVSDPAMADARWFTDVLQHAGALSDAVVTAVERTRIGTGQTGLNVAFSLTYDKPAPDAPATVVGKFPSQEPQSRAAAKTFSLYEREIGFYEIIAETVDIRVPVCYFADIDLETGDFVLLLEDLRPAVQGDQLAGCSVDEALLAMSELAGLHAPRWDDPALADIEWLGQSDDTQSGDMLQMVYQGLWPGFVAQYGPSLSADALALGETFGCSVGDWGRDWTPPACVTHGDYRLDNMMFGTEEGGYPLTTVDWQTVGHGPGIRDAAYFIGAGLTLPERRAHEMDLLKHYHDALVARGVGGYEWQRCLDDYKRATLAGVLMTVIASQAVASDDRGRAMFAAMAERHFAHAIDHQATDRLTHA